MHHTYDYPHPVVMLDPRSPLAHACRSCVCYFTKARGQAVLGTRRSLVRVSAGHTRRMPMIPRAEAVILVHGLFMTGWDMTVLRRRLLRIGFTPYQFSYPSTRFEPLRNAQDLKNFTDRIDAPVVHFVAHSLGGLVVRHFFHDSPSRRPGRIVTLATPHQGSRAAAKLALTRCGRAVLRKSLEQGLLGDLPAWNGQHEIGAIAGSASIGLGRLFAEIARPNDGTVAVSEALLPNATDNVVLPVAHFGMLLSRRVAEEVGFFLRHGRFEHAA